MKPLERILGVRLEELPTFESFDQIEGWDSLMLMQTVVTLEKEIGARLSTEEIVELSPRKLFELLNNE